MTTIVKNYVFSPLSGLWSSIERTMMIAGYSRAAAELSRQGYHEEAKRTMIELTKLRD
tara:strand:- start:3140 stop:3313 length:174 start_codon:yes stop_codon:yes gene_type:complete